MKARNIAGDEIILNLSEKSKKFNKEEKQKEKNT